MASAAISQLSCFSALNRRLPSRFHYRSFPNLRPKTIVHMSNSEHVREGSISEIRMASSYAEDASVSQNGSSLKSYPAIDEPVPSKEEIGPLQEPIVTQPKKTAKIHDFCLGIPFGGIVLTSGLVGSVLSRNPAILRTGVFFGGPLLALSTLSLNVWRKGKSSLPFMLGQAVLAAVLMWKSAQTYALTKQVLPMGFYVIISAAMLCFYAYVVLSGGNPPPKKMKSAAAQL